METEQGRLERMYGELGDEHLQDLAEEPENLTDEARLALGAEMRRRGFAFGVGRAVGDAGGPGTDSAVADGTRDREQGFGPSVPGIFPGGADAVEQALEPGGKTRLGWVSVISFYDGHQLTLACEHLEDAEVEVAIEEIGGDAQAGAPTRFEVWVEAADAEKAQRVLRAKMGLFPLPEVDGDGATFTGEGTGVVGVFETRDEAEEVKAMLAQEGIAATAVRDDADVDDADGAGSSWNVLVAPAEEARAVAVVGRRMGLV